MATETREILFKFTASEIEIQKSLEKVSQSLIDARNELKELNQSFNLATKTISNYENELGQLNKQVAQNDLTQEEYNKAVEELNLDLKTAQNTVADYTKNQVRLKQEIQKLSTEQRGYIKDLQNLEKVTDKAEGSNEQLRASVALLTREYNKLSKEERETSARGQLLTKTLREQTDALKENEKAVGDNRRNVGNYQDAFSGLTGGITETIGSLAGPSGLVAGITIAADLIGDGIKAVQEITAEFVILRGEVQGLTGATGESLDNLTSKIKATAKVFDQDFKEVLRLVNQQAKDFGIPFDEALTNIQKGFLDSANNADFFTERLDEYSPILSKVGLTSKETNAIINEEIRSGVYSDKGIDAIKEAGERLALMEKPALEAAEALQLDPEKLKGKTIFEQIQLISGELRKLPKDSKESAIAIEGFFGTAGLDAGQRYLETFADINTELDKQLDRTNPLINLQLKQLEVGQRLAEAQNELSKAFEGSNGELDLLIDEGKIFLIEVLLGIIERLKPVISAISTFIDFLGRVGDAFTFVEKKVNEFLKGIGLITEDIEIFGSAAEFVVDALVNVFTGGFGAIFDAVGFAFDLLKDFINFASSVPDRLSNIFNTFKEFSNDLLGTSFEIEPQINIDTSEAGKKVDALQIKLDELALPAPVAPAFDVEKAKAGIVEVNEAVKSENEKAAKQREKSAVDLSRKLKIIDQNRLKEEIAGIELRLLEVAKGSLEELNIRKNLLQKQSELTLTTRQLTANEELLIIKKTDEKKIDESKAFADTKLQLSINGLKGIQGALQQRFNKELALEAEAVANAKLTTEAIVITKEQGQRQIQKTSKEVLEEITLNEQIAATQSQEFSGQTLRAQIRDLKKLLENERLTAEERKQIEEQLQSAKLQQSAEVLQGISQLTGAFTTFFAAQKEKQLEAAQGNAEKEAEINEKFAKREKRLAIFESIVNTGVAVVKALPNIPLSILVGTIGAIQTAAIANTSFASGGFTGVGLQDDPNERGRKIAGVVHDNEYVIPTNVLKRPEGMKLALEAEKMRGFAGGGFTTPPTFSDGGMGITRATESISVDQLAKAFKDAVKTLPAPEVNVNEVTRMQNRVKTKETTGL